jgi:hypothetical protein
MSSRVPSTPTGVPKEGPPKSDDHASDDHAEASRQWNRDLRHTVRAAKDHAQAMSDRRHGPHLDTPRRPN